MIKFNFLSLILALTIATLLPSCGKDDDSSTTTAINTFSYDGNNYSLVNGFMTPYGSNGNGSFDFDVFLGTQEITLADGQLNGVGDMLYIDLNTGLSTGLEEGTYNWSDTRAPFTIVQGTSFNINSNASTGSGAPVSVTGGTVEIAIDGTEVTITADLQTSGSGIVGTFKGSIADF